ncbi:MAG TPA: tetratricopeptide repeat protein, partial [Anaeromyxobacter sp.]
LRGAPAEAGVLHQAAAEALFDLGLALDRAGRLPEAEGLYAEAARASPELTEAHVNLGRIASIQGRTAEARACYLRAIETNGLSGSAHRMLGRLLAEEGDPAGAIPHLRAAVRIAPGTAELHEDLGLSLAMTRRVDDALAEFREALRLAPDWPAALDRVALLLATHPEPRRRDPGEAIRLADRALHLTGGKDPMALEVAAAAYASAGRFSDAEGAEQKVLDLAVGSGNDGLAGAARATLEVYRRKLPLPPAEGPGAP